MKLLFHGESMTARGTLYHLKDFFRHRAVKGDVAANVQHVWDLIQVSGSSMISRMFIFKNYHGEANANHA